MHLETYRHHNPEVFGQDVETVGWGIVGLFGTSVLNDKLVAPTLDKAVPTLDNNKGVRKVVDGATTLGVAFLLSEGLGKVRQRARVPAQLTGSVLGFTRILTAFVPGFQLSAETPDSINLPILHPGHVSQVPQLAAAGGSPGYANSSYTATADYSSPQPDSIGQQAYGLQGGI